MKNQEEKQEPTEDIDAGNEPTADEKIKNLNADTERINNAIAENENAKARQKLGGISSAGQEQEKPKEETPQEYVDKMRKQGWKADE